MIGAGRTALILVVETRLGVRAPTLAKRTAAEIGYVRPGRPLRKR